MKGHDVPSKPPRTNIDKWKKLLKDNKLDIELAGILVDVQVGYYARLQKGDDVVGGFEQELKKLKQTLLTYIKELTKDPAVIKRAEEDLR